MSYWSNHTEEAGPAPAPTQNEENPVQALKVTFNVVEEFLAELRQQAGEYTVNPAVVRLTRRYHRSQNLPIQLVMEVSTFVANGQLFELTQFAGDLWGHGNSEDAKTQAAAKEVMDRIEAAAKDLDLPVRPGVFGFQVA